MVRLLEDLWRRAPAGSSTTGTTGTTGTSGPPGGGPFPFYQVLKRKRGGITQDIEGCVPYVEQDVTIRFGRD